MATILMVEDDPGFAEALDRGLRAARFDVVAASDSLAALRLLDSDQRVDMLLTDIKMPEGQPHGIALSLMARRQRPSLPVIFMSGYPDLIRDAGLDETVFAKPFNLAILVEAIRQRLEST
jgi:DNA-binding response OmpR family regulator